MGESRTPTHGARLIRRQHLRIRTVAVSFAAAVTSARQDMDVGTAERDALIETWRTWSLDVLEGYRDDMDEVARGAETVSDEDLAGVRTALSAAIERVRTA